MIDKIALIIGIPLVIWWFVLDPIRLGRKARAQQRRELRQAALQAYSDCNEPTRFV
jgi:hypothetical protein